MLSAVEALAHLLKNASPVNEEETVPTQAALGRVLAKDIASQVDVPPLDNTSMDGYAVRSSEITQVGTVLRMAQRIPAGSVGQSLETGTIARIFTGAPIPQGADAVVMQEDCIVQDQNELVQINSVPNAGQWIRRRGEDLTAGKLALTAGSLLRPQQLGVAASAGYAQLPVKRKVRVAAFFTGDELSLPGEPLKPGGIYNSNRDTLLGVIRSLGCEATDYGIVPDRLEATRAALRTASANHDLIITSGGVSVGEEDHIKPAVNAEGRLDLWQIAIKPGKPLAFGAVRKQQQSDQETWFIGLPGNPVSSFVTFLLFVRPFILKLQGRSDLSSPSYLMRADFDWLKPDRRNEFLRVKINAQGGLDLFPNQSSGVLTSAAWGDGLLDCPAGQGFKKGDMVRYIPFSGLLS
ncbi:MAG: molybdopterin molybdenumtransferase MoeA [Burkholderiaceae bacterium]|jgi:molybdopterin molybdotransferase|nr:molybdopterin molybdenumtransferase MoeA [Burkholderiaceae bacterium]NCY00396.1 molybdopterin molybdenumtransferase MoeA [Burkholderiaceae bacterium]NDB23538.1 molybdopterin molybdenumtransferase MoeA [Burkholderiaceae bacterium]NDF20858.1 molybdopterin molybdenumtransferase MoeA [Burkholderiaceae bacterium]NDG90627.1 molybdopterin molybdenumtransferase MoeA [Burkholderiaceae bacterium]